MKILQSLSTNFRNFLWYKCRDPKINNSKQNSQHALSHDWQRFTQSWIFINRKKSVGTTWQQPLHISLRSILPQPLSSRVYLVAYPVQILQELTSTQFLRILLKKNLPWIVIHDNLFVISQIGGGERICWGKRMYVCDTFRTISFRKFISPVSDSNEVINHFIQSTYPLRCCNNSNNSLLIT